jgi:hypothetical protein
MQQPLSTPPPADGRDQPADQDAYAAFWNCVEDSEPPVRADVTVDAGQPADAYEQFLASADTD